MKKNSRGKVDQNWADRYFINKAYLKQYPSESCAFSSRYKTEDLDPNFHEKYIKNTLDWRPKR